MSYRTSLNRIVLPAAGGTTIITATDSYEEYVLVGSATLVGNVTVVAVGTPIAPVRIRVMYKATLTEGAFRVTIFGNVLNSQQSLSGNIIVDAIYDGTQWLSWIVDAFVAPNYEGFRTVAVNLAGATVNITNADKQVQYFTGNGVLAGNYSVTFSGTFREGQTFYLKFAATLTIGASVLTVFGQNITAAQALGGNYTLIAWYDLANTTFRTQLIAAPPSSGAGSFSTLPVALAGTLYPPASAGDTFRITCAAEKGRLGSIVAVPPYLEEPAVRIVYNNDTLYCLTTTAGGDTAAAGAAFYVPDAPRDMAPVSNTAGDSNFRVNAPNGLTSADNTNTVGAGTNVGNGFWGYSIGVSGSSRFNWLVGISHVVSGALYNIVCGVLQTFSGAAANNLAGGQLNSYTGSNNVGAGSGNAITGTDNLVVGNTNSVAASRSMISGAGVSAQINNGLYLGGSASPSPAGAEQVMIFPLAGTIADVVHPDAQPLTIAVNEFGGSGFSLLLGSNSMAWSFEAKIIVAQTAVGADHTNTSAVGDWAEYIVAGVVRRSAAGTTTLTNTKWFDHRNRWIPTTTPNALCYRNRTVTGARADMNLVQPSVSIAANTLTFAIKFPGFASLMTDQGAGTTPQFAFYVANADINGGVALTFGGVLATDSAMPNTVVPAAAPFIAAVFRNPVADIFDGSDANSNGYYGGIGVGATATALTRATSVASIGYFNYGSYTIGVTATVTFNGGNATGVATMSGIADCHIGNNVAVLTGGTYTGPNGSYALVFTGGAGVGATGTATVVGGAITAIIITNGGSGYASTDVVVITCPAAGQVVAATFTVTLYESIASIAIGGANNNYTNATDLTITFGGAGLTQASATAQITPQAIDGAGTITVNTGGVGYGLRFPTVGVFDAGGTLFEDGNGGDFRASGHIVITQIKYA